MIVGDVLIARLLRQDLAYLRSDSRAIQDLVEHAPEEVQDSVRKYFSDPRNQVEIRQGFTTNPPTTPQIVIVLAGEEESNTPIGGVLQEGYWPTDVERIALTMEYTGPDNHRVRAVVDTFQGVLLTEVYNTGDSVMRRAYDQELHIDLTTTPTVTDLVGVINGYPNYEAAVVEGYEGTETNTIDRQIAKWLEEGPTGITIIPSTWGSTKGTMFRSTWKITAVATNANVTIWLQAFIKWCMLRHRIDMDYLGLHAAQMAGGDFEPAPEWLQINADAVVYLRGVILTAEYIAQYTDRYDAVNIKTTDVFMDTPDPYTVFG